MSYHFSTLKKLSNYKLDELLKLSKIQQDTFRKDQEEIELAEEQGRAPNLIYKYIKEEDQNNYHRYLPSLNNGLISLISLEESYVSIGTKKKEKVHRIFINSPDSKALSNVGWILNEDLKKCLQCKLDFQYVPLKGPRRTRRHCRCCGDLICNNCAVSNVTVEEGNPPIKKTLPVQISGLEELGGVIVCKQCLKRANGNKVELIGNIYNSPSLLKIKKKRKLDLPLKMMILPSPGFVIKCKTKDQKSKVFINVYYHKSVNDEDLTLYRYLPPNEDVYIQNFITKEEKEEARKEFKLIINQNLKTQEERNLKINNGIDEGNSFENHRIGYYKKDPSGYPDRYCVPIIYIGSEDYTTDKHNDKCMLYSVVISEKYFINHHRLLKYLSMKQDGSLNKPPKKKAGKKKSEDDEDDEDEMSLLFSNSTISLEGLHLPIYHASIAQKIMRVLQFHYSNTPLILDELSYSFPRISTGCKGNPLYYPEIFVLNERNLYINLDIPFEPITSLTSSTAKDDYEDKDESGDRKNYISISSINDITKRGTSLSESFNDFNKNILGLAPLPFFKQDNTNALIEKEFLSMQLRDASVSPFPTSLPPKTLKRKDSNASLVSSISDVSDISTTSKLSSMFSNSSGVLSNSSPLVVVTLFFSSKQLESSYTNLSENKKKMFKEFYSFVQLKLYNNYNNHLLNLSLLSNSSSAATTVSSVSSPTNISSTPSIPSSSPTQLNSSYPTPLHPSELKLDNFPITYIFPLLLITEGCFQVINEKNLPLSENELLISSSINFPDILLGYQIILNNSSDISRSNFQFNELDLISKPPQNSKEYVDIVRQFYLDYNPNLFLITGVRKSSFKKVVEYRLSQIQFTPIDNDINKKLELPSRLLPGNLPSYFANISLVHTWKKLKKKDEINKGLDDFKTLRKVLPFANKK